MIRVLIVDDEPIARDGIRTLLGSSDDVVVVGECGNGSEAVDAIRAKRPDLVFLDIQMPDMDGFEVLAQLEADEVPIVIFATAYDDYALRAFEVNAVDYLLKPFDSQRFLTCLQRVRKRLETEPKEKLVSETLALVRDLASRRRTTSSWYGDDRIPIKGRHKVTFVLRRDIDWIEVRGNYVRLHLGEESHLVRNTMSELQASLPGSQFVRINRSQIVNGEKVKGLRKLPNGRYRILLNDGMELDASRRYTKAVKSFFGLTP